MLELLAYLRANGFKTFIVSGGGIEFMRPWTEKVYGIPPEQVVGSSIKTRFEMQDGRPVLFRLPEINFIDDKVGKPIGINQHIGRRPIAAFGNSDGDLEMLQYTTLSGGAALRPDRAPHRCGARIRLRPQIPLRKARQGARRRGGQQMDRGRHEERLEEDLSRRRVTHVLCTARDPRPRVADPSLRLGSINQTGKRNTMSSTQHDLLCSPVSECSL